MTDETPVDEKKPLKYGDIIPIKDEHKKHIKCISDGIDAAKSGLNALTHTLNISQERLWKAIREYYPETEEYSCSFCSEKLQVKIESKLKSYERW